MSHSPTQFVLAGVDNLTCHARLTGPGAINDTAAVGVEGTDLGIIISGPGRYYFAFGDTFDQRPPGAWGGVGDNWRSNVLAWSSAVDVQAGPLFDGWITDEAGHATEFLPGLHQPDGTGEVTKIPTGGFTIGTDLYVHFMSVRHWGDDGYWDCDYSSLACSRDGGRTFSVLDQLRWGPDSGFTQNAVALVSDAGASWLHHWGIPAGRQGDVRLMRVPADGAALADRASWQYWSGWDRDGHDMWSASVHDARVVAAGPHGELSVAFNPYLGRWLMTFSERGYAKIREGLTPAGPWGPPLLFAGPTQYPVLYAPFMCADLTAAGGKTVFFTMSVFGPYAVYWFSMDLIRADGRVPGMDA